MLSHTSNKQKLDIVDVTIYGELLLDFCTYKEVYWQLSQLSKYFLKYTAKYRLKSIIAKVESLAGVLQIPLPNTNLPSLDEQFMEMRAVISNEILRRTTIKDSTSLTKELAAGLLYPSYVKNLFPVLRSLLKNYSDQLAKAATDIITNLNNNKPSIQDQLRNGANVNYMLAQTVLIRSNAEVLHEELLSYPDVDLATVFIGSADLQNTLTINNLEKIKALYFKGAHYEDLICGALKKPWGNVDRVPQNVITFLEYSEKFMNDFYVALQFSNYITASQDGTFLNFIFKDNLSRYDLNRLTQTLLNNFSIILKMTYGDALSQLNFLKKYLAHLEDPKQLDASEAARLSILKYIAQIADPSKTLIFSTFKTFFESIRIGQEGPNILSMTGKQLYEPYIKSVISKSLQDKGIVTQVNNYSSADISLGIISARMREIFISPNANSLFEYTSLAFASLLRLLDIRTLPQSLITTVNADTVSMLFYLFTNRSEIEKLAKRIGSYFYPESKTITWSLSKGMKSKTENELDVTPHYKDTDIVHLNLNKSIFIDEHAIHLLKKSYHELLNASESETQVFVDNEFKSIKAFPEIKELQTVLNEIDKLTNDFIAKTYNVKATHALLADIKLFVETLSIYPRDPRFKFLNAKIYENTSSSKLITKYGLIQPDRLKIQPIYEAAEMLRYRYP